MEQSEGTFHDAVLKICPHYFDLFDVMKDHSSSKPQIISQELNEIIVEPLTTDDEEDSSINNNNDTHNPNDDNTESQENSHPNSWFSNNTTIEVVATTADIVPVATPLIMKWKRTLKKEALLARGSIANVKMIWTWIHFLSIRRKPPL